ncbi:MAG: hypothetical protein LBD77_11100, partial [Bifidobacteriaceae bacterium]|nr:hypothetical protein [Bifidobacteriaceae bacterium]
MVETPQARPKLRSNLAIGVAQDGKVTVSDPVANRHFLLSTVALTVLEHFDGVRSDEEILSQLVDANLGVSQEGIDLVRTQAATMGLFEDVAAEGAAPAHLRGPTRRNIAFLKIAEVDPSRVVNALRPVGHVLFSIPALVALAGLLVGAGFAISHNATRYIDDLLDFGRIGVWPLVYVCVAAITVLHEFGHALAVARFGGAVHRMGLSLYLLAPAAYADTSDAWRFPRVRQRIVVNLGGLYVEAYVLVAGIFLWAAGVLPDMIGAAVFVSCHVILGRILMNLNPLLRLDGYWLASDALRIPNMRTKAFGILLGTISPFRADRSLARIASSTEERLVLLSYAILSLIWIFGTLALSLFAINSFLEQQIAWRGDIIAKVLMVTLVILLTVSGWKYIRSLRSTYSAV